MSKMHIITQATIPRIARASPNYMAPNGQPRKGCNPADVNDDAARKTGTAAARRLTFPSKAPLPVKSARTQEGSRDSTDWVIPAAPRGA